MLRVELVKQVWRARSLATVVLLMAIPLVAGVTTASHAGARNGAQGGLYGAASFSALNHVAACLAFCTPLLLALAAALFGSALGAADRGWGTLRYLYVQPVSPGRLIAGKAGALVVCVALTVAALLLSALIVGLIVFGWHPFHRLGDLALSPGAAGLRLLAGGAYVTVCMLSAGAIALALGTLLPGPAEALAATVALVVVTTIMAGQASLHAVAPLLPVHYWQRWTALLDGHHADLAGGLAVQLVTIAIALAVTVVVVGRRDPAA